MMKQTVLGLLLLLLASFQPGRAQDAHLFEVSKHLEIFNNLYKELDLYYVDTLNAEKLIGDAIGYMLSGLDPYTEYYSERDAQDFNTMTTGKYAGIGALIAYSKQYDQCVIKEPYENMPAAKAGLQPGDVIKLIDGVAIDKKGTKAVGDYTSSVSSRLRGEPGTQITIEVNRPGVGERTFKFERAAVQLPAVSYAGMVTDSIGYIQLSTFTRGCSTEVQQAYLDLKKRGARSLILDLRNNGGGLAIEAVNIVNLFVPKGKLILQMKGKDPAVNSTYATQNAPVDLDVPIVVAVNANSASASEITCGSLQDLDRAVVLGDRTYGKGLVQQPRDLPYGATLKLTTSHYYIPSGRCIQALDYSKRARGEEIYRTPDSLTHEFKTEAGRLVRDGGGITPDVTVRADSVPNLLLYLQESAELVEYIARYRAKHETIAPAAEFSVTEQDYEDFKAYLTASPFTYDQQTSKILQELKRMARFEGYDRTAGAEIKALEDKLQHNLAGDLDAWKPQVIRLLNTEICQSYYFARGAIASQLAHDQQINAAISLLRRPSDYKALLKAPKAAKK